MRESGKKSFKQEFLSFFSEEKRKISAEQISLPREKAIQDRYELRNRFGRYTQGPERSSNVEMKGHYVGPIPPKPFVGKVLDYISKWITKKFSGAPQETHFWNVAKNLSQEFINALDESLMVSVPGTKKGWEWAKNFPKMIGDIAMHSRWGWRDYVVLEVDRNQYQLDGSWNIGWKKDDGTVEASRIPLTDGRVRMLKGPIGTTTQFFAIHENGTQIPLKIVGHGNLDKKGEFEDIRLL